MKKLTAIMIILAVSMGVFAQDWSIPVECPIETSQPADLLELTWSQGSSPLMAFDVTRRGRPIDVDTNTIVRMIIAPTATNDYFVVVTNYLASGSTYYVQWPTVGTNTADTVWWYTVYFEVDGSRYWTGNGELCITPTTSTDDGLTWQALTTNAGVISNAADIAINAANIVINSNAIANISTPENLMPYTGALSNLVTELDITANNFTAEPDVLGTGGNITLGDAVLFTQLAQPFGSIHPDSIQNWLRFNLDDSGDIFRFDNDANFYGNIIVQGTASGIDAVLDAELATLGQLNTALDLRVPYTGASANVDLGDNDLTVNTDTFHIDSVAEYVGIGTATPADPLEVYFNNSTGSDIGFKIVNTNENSTGAYAGIRVQAQGGTVDGQWMCVPEFGSLYMGGGLLFKTITDHDLVFITNNDNANPNMIIDSTTGNIAMDDDLTVGGTTQSANYKSGDGTAGIDTTFVDADGNTITVKDGLITAKTAP